MVKYEDLINDTCDFFKILGDPTRLKIMLAIQNESLCVNDISSKLNMTKYAVSHQLAILWKSRLVRNEKKGKEVYYKLADEHVETVVKMAFEHVSE